MPDRERHLSVEEKRVLSEKTAVALTTAAEALRQGVGPSVCQSCVIRSIAYGFLVPLGMYVASATGADREQVDVFVTMLADVIHEALEDYRANDPGKSPKVH